MSFLVEGGSISYPPFLDRSNYLYWKARMKVFINALDAKAQRLMLTGWKHPTTKDDESSVVLTPVIKWFANNDGLANYVLKP